MIALLALSAFLAERAALLAGRPARWAWAAAMLASLALPSLVAVRSLAAAPVAPSTADVAGGAGRTGRTAWEALLAQAAERAPGVVAAVAAPGVWARVDRPLALMWATAALLLLARRAVAARRLAHRARWWPECTVAGTRVRVAPDAGPAVMGALRSEVVLPA